MKNICGKTFNPFYGLLMDIHYSIAIDYIYGYGCSATLWLARRTKNPEPQRGSTTITAGRTCGNITSITTLLLALILATNGYAQEIITPPVPPNYYDGNFAHGNSYTWGNALEKDPDKPYHKTSTFTDYGNATLTELYGSKTQESRFSVEQSAEHIYLTNLKDKTKTTMRISRKDDVVELTDAKTEETFSRSVKTYLTAPPSVIGVPQSNKETAEGDYDENGNKIGEWKQYHRNGELKSIGWYKNANQIGEWKTYHHNGQLYHIGTYDNGKETGEWRYYDLRGNLIKTEKH